MTTAVARRPNVTAKRDEAFGDRLRELRDASGLSQFALAVKAGVQPNSIARLERGEIHPTWATVRALADALMVGVEQFTVPPKKRKKGG
jgi:transcriptional regulator with XRE-family HTH domain